MNEPDTLQADFDHLRDQMIQIEWVVALSDLDRDAKLAQIDNLASQALENIDNKVYCDRCGACGESDCCPPERCQTMRCRYGLAYFDDHHESVKQYDRMYSTLLGMGFADPYEVSDRDVRRVAYKIQDITRVANGADDQPCS